MKPPNVRATRHYALRFAWLLLACSFLLFPSLSYAAAGPLDLTLTLTGISSVVIFVLAYALVMSEELLHMRKSKPVLVAAGLIWALVAWVYVQACRPADGHLYTSDAAAELR
mgnify:CR=1 FL=1